MNRFNTLIWFLFRPKYWEHTVYKIRRKFLLNHDTPKNKIKATKWASLNSVSSRKALLSLGFKGAFVNLNSNYLKYAKMRASKSPVKMGGPADLNLLYNSVKLLKASRVIETGVAYGWSSLSILKAFSERKKGVLYSVDMPYPKKNNEEYVGIVVPKNLRKYWCIIRKPDRPAIIDAIKLAKYQVDLCHYDSDKNWWGRSYAYPLLWNALRPGGLFISDDIQDNLYFSYFVKSKSLNFAITKHKGKFIGLIRK